MLNVLSGIESVKRDDVSVAATLVDPDATTCLQQGEWVTIATGNVGTRVGASSVKQAYQVFSMPGAYSSQTLNRVAVNMVGEYVGETDMFADGGGGWTVGNYLTVKQITVDSVTRSGLTQAAAGEYVYGIILETPSANGGKLKFRKVEPFFWAVS